MLIQKYCATIIFDKLKNLNYKEVELESNLMVNRFGTLPISFRAKGLVIFTKNVA